MIFGIISNKPILFKISVFWRCLSKVSHVYYDLLIKGLRFLHDTLVNLICEPEQLVIVNLLMN